MIKYITLIFVLFTNLLFSQKKDTLNFVEKPKFETKKLIVPLSLMATGTVVLFTEKRDVPVTENKKFSSFWWLFRRLRTVFTSCFCLLF